MSKRGSSLKELLEGNQPVVGIGASLGSLRSVEILANSEFDFAMIDTMHGHFDKGSATDAVRSLLRTGPAPLVRVSDSAGGQINDSLDAGALGVVIPMVESRAEAQAAVEACYYPPRGKRSKGSVASVVHGPDYATFANDLVSVIVMIETLEAASRAADILSVDGITACLIGASDLQFIMAVDRDSDGFTAVVDQVVAAGRANGVAVGISVAEAGEVPFWVERGLTFFLASHDLAVLNGAICRYDESFAQVRKAR